MCWKVSKALSFDPFKKYDLLEGDAKHIVIIIFGDYGDDIF